MSSEEIFDPINCTVETCSIEEYGQMDYIPNLAGNALYLGIFGVLILAQLFLGIRHKTWGFMIAMVSGILLEIVGYAGRIMLHDNIFDNNNFIIYIVGLTIGPAFLAAAIYLCLGRIITIYSTELSILSPKWITIIFIICDFVSLVLQGAGGGITATADDSDGSQMGIDIMIAGLASQVATMTFFIIICGLFAWKVYKNPNKLEPAYAPFRNSLRWKSLLAAIGLSVTTIFIRCIFRLIELQEGFDGELANNEVDFMVLEGVMIIVACILLTAWHPGWVLGANLWVDASFHLRSSKEKNNVKEVGTSGSNSMVEMV